MFYKILFLTLLIAFFNIGMRFTDDSSEKSISVTVTNIRNNKGRIQLQMFKTEESYNKEKPWKTFYISKQNMKNKSVSKNLGKFEKGIYGIGVLDDENKNGKMDDSFFIPIEGFGFSNYYHTQWSTPSFDKFKFRLTDTKKVVCKLRYL